MVYCLPFTARRTKSGHPLPPAPLPLVPEKMVPPLRPTVERLAKAMLGQACPEDRVRYYN